MSTGATKDATTINDATAIIDSILRLTGERGFASSICPSEVARALALDGNLPDWRPLLGPVRREAAALARAGRIDILRKGKPIDPDHVKGVVRLRARDPVQTIPPAPDVPEPDGADAAPDVPEPDVPEPDVPEPDVPEPDGPEPDGPPDTNVR